MSDLIDRQAAIESIRECAEAAHSMHDWDMEQGYLNAIECIEEEPSAQPEQLTDAEQRIFLKAIEREEKVCKKVDEEWGSGDEECEINLVHACHEIIRKVKGALWI